MTVYFEERTQFSVIEVEGMLRAPVGIGLRQQVDAHLRSGERRIVLDLRRLTDIDAAGIGELVDSYNAARAAGGILRIEGASERVRTLLEVAGVWNVLERNNDEAGDEVDEGEPTS